MVKDTRLYDLLNVECDAPQVTIKKAFHAAALRCHPDKNNHSEESKKQFQEISKAYEVLSDPKSREMYDRYGTTDESAIASQEPFGEGMSFYSGGNPMHMFGTSAGDLFAQFFNSSGDAGPSFGFGSRFDGFGNSAQAHGARDGHMRTGPDIKHYLKCNLSDLYQGKKTKLGLNRMRVCSSCDGKGGMRVASCRTCKGQGEVVKTRRVGPMVQTMSSTCNSCHGTGTFIKDSDLCFVCKGSGVSKERKIFDVEVKAGMTHNQVIVLPGEADEVIETSHGLIKVQPGDVVIVIDLVKNTQFQVVNDHDLVLKNCEVPLKTCLCGGEIMIEGHPSGKIIKLSIIPNELLKPSCFKTVEGLGMPKVIANSDHANIAGTDIDGYGNLYVQFQVKFPERLEDTTITKLQEILEQDPNVKKEDESDQKRIDDAVTNSDGAVEVEEHVLSDFVPDYKNFKEFKRSRSNRSDSRKRRRCNDDDDCIVS